MSLPYIPETITVHLGAPDDKTARNVTVPFPDYIKNVASSEIYPTWPENAIRANMYAQISFALNRIYTEWYRSQGYDFDITNSTAFDQAYVDGRDIFENISEIADELFNDYVIRPGTVEPYFTQYCNGTTVQCDGLSQWGTVPLAEAGLSPLEILQEFFGPDLEIVENAPVAPNIGSFPGTLRLGDVSDGVRIIQQRLNRISNNYPAIPKIYPVDGVYDQGTVDAVRKFQEIFGLTPDGIVGKATWYRIAYLFTAVAQLAELNSEGVRPEDIENLFPTVLQRGDRGSNIRVLQYYLRAVALFYPDLRDVVIDGEFGPETEAAVRAFQKKFDLAIDGIVGKETWGMLDQIYSDIIASIPDWELSSDIPPFPRRLVEGMSGTDVAQVQEWLNTLGKTFPEIQPLPVTGYFGQQTAAAVSTAQSLLGLDPVGFVGPITWDTLARQAMRVSQME